MSALAMLAGAAILAAGVLAGRFLPARRASRPPAPARPVCGCDHDHAYHDPQTSQCHGRVEIGYWGSQYHYEDCTCRQYSGPLPMPEYFAPEITP
jgi:hypothetical protein